MQCNSFDVYLFILSYLSPRSPGASWQVLSPGLILAELISGIRTGNLLIRCWRSIPMRFLNTRRYFQHFDRVYRNNIKSYFLLRRLNSLFKFSLWRNFSLSTGFHSSLVVPIFTMKLPCYKLKIFETWFI